MNLFFVLLLVLTKSGNCINVQFKVLGLTGTPCVYHNVYYYKVFGNDDNAIAMTIMVTMLPVAYTNFYIL